MLLKNKTFYVQTFFYAKIKCREIKRYVLLSLYFSSLGVGSWTEYL